MFRRGTPLRSTLTVSAILSHVVPRLHAVIASAICFQLFIQEYSTCPRRRPGLREAATGRSEEIYPIDAGDRLNIDIPPRSPHRAVAGVPSSHQQPNEPTCEVLSRRFFCRTLSLTTDLDLQRHHALVSMPDAGKPVPLATVQEWRPVFS